MQNQPYVKLLRIEIYKRAKYNPNVQLNGKNMLIKTYF